MKLLFADKFPEHFLKQLEELGHRVTSNPGLSAEDLPAAVEDNEVLVVRSTKVTENTFNAAKNLGLVIRAGAGTNTINVNAAAAKGIFVCNTPGKNALAVAELAFGLLLSIDRNIPDNVIEMRSGTWDKKRFSKTRGIFGRNAGIVGLGKIGMAFAKRAHAFGMNIFVIEKSGRTEETLKELEKLKVTFCSGLNELAQKCDVISFHVPSTQATRGLINKKFLSQLQPDSIIINTSRGDIVDDEALIAAMDEKNIRAGLDVFNNEPTKGKDNISTPLSQHPNVYGTHHIGASTEQAQLAIAKTVVNLISDFEKGIISNCVNLEKNVQLIPSLSIRHFDKVGVLSSILDILKKQNINVGQLENREFSGKNSAYTNIFTENEISGDIVGAIASLPDVIHVAAKNL